MSCARSLIHGVGQCDWQPLWSTWSRKGNSPVEAVGSCGTEGLWQTKQLIALREPGGAAGLVVLVDMIPVLGSEPLAGVAPRAAKTFLPFSRRSFGLLCPHTLSGLPLNI